MRAYYAGTHPDGFPDNGPLRDVPALAAGTLISFVVAFLAGGSAIYGVWRIDALQQQDQQEENIDVNP